MNPGLLPHPGSNPISLAVLDMAGTTIDEQGSARKAVLEALDRTGGPPEAFEATFARMRGGAKTAMFEALLADPALARSAHSEFEAALERLVRAGNVAPLPGATDTVRQLRDLGVKVALATGFSVRVRDVLLNELGWTELVDLVLSPEEVGRGRPHPDGVLTAVLRLQVEAVQAVAVVGDTTNDLLSGSRAGASIVAGVLTGAHDRTRLEEAPHTHIIDTIADLPAIIEQAGQAA